MAFVEPEFTRSQITRAGRILAMPSKHSRDDLLWALDVLANWRACHAYPMNTFQATLRMRLRKSFGKSIVAQRLKRSPSIISKLQRFKGMELARMQDIAGLRTILGTVSLARKLEARYVDPLFPHPLTSHKNYIDEPKADGYRSIHLIFRYANKQAPAYDGLSLELQIRTNLQHAWATAVETMGTFLGQALKSGQGDAEWRTFFTLVSAAFAVIEKSASVPGYEGHSPSEIFAELTSMEQRLRVTEKLQGFAVAAGHITREKGKGTYHLIVLDSSTRSVTIRPYAIAHLEQAASDYAKVEARTRAGEQLEAVLVSAGPIDALRKAYPNYFLDTQAFIRQIQMIVSEVAKS